MNTIIPRQLGMKVPEPIRVVFDTFPLRTYAPVLDKSTQNDEHIFFFSKKGDSSTTKESECFHLGVHKVNKSLVMGKMVFLPSDPIGLADCLILCHRHNLLLPRDAKDEKSVHSITELSYLASPDNELPILLEGKDAVAQKIVSSGEISKSVSNNYFSKNSQAFFINDYLDSLVDLWIFILLVDIPQSHNPCSTYSSLFYQDDQVKQSDSLLYLTTLKLIGEMANWNFFKKRYSYLFQQEKSIYSTISRINKSNFLKAFAVCNETAFEKVYFEKLMDFERFLSMVMKYLEQEQESEAKTIIEIKLASFCFAFSLLKCQNTHIERLMKKYPEVIEFSERIISRY